MIDQPIQTDQTASFVHPINPSSTKRNFPKYLGMIFILSILVAGSIIGVLAIKNQQLMTQINQQQVQITKLSVDLGQQMVATSPTNLLPTLSQNPLPKLTPMPSPNPSSNTPTGWVTMNFPSANLSFSVPSNWKSDIQSFPNVPSQLIRLWQGATADTATIELDIKNNWDNTGNAIDQPRNFPITASLSAAQVDPPRLSQQKLDRYQTNYYFEQAGKVYILTCVHNWIPAQYQLCQQILKTLHFSN